jgi:glycosyltransferase involved in cell wall biosynthesis
LEKEEYEEFLSACDVGLIFLDYRFTIANFPSRLLTYMDHSLPIITCTDPNTDIGRTVNDGGFGFGVLSNDTDNFLEVVRKMLSTSENERKCMGERGRRFLEMYYSVERAYETMMKILEPNC